MQMVPVTYLPHELVHITCILISVIARKVVIWNVFLFQLCILEVIECISWVWKEKVHWEVLVQISQECTRYRLYGIYAYKLLLMILWLVSFSVWCVICKVNTQWCLRSSIPNLGNSRTLASVMILFLSD